MSIIAYKTALNTVGRNLPHQLVIAGDHHHCESCGQLTTPGIYPHHVILKDKEIARLIGCSLSSLRNKRSQGGGIPFVRDGRAIGYLLSDYVGYVESLPRYTNTSQYGENV